MSELIPSGLITALVTPFKGAGDGIDGKVLRQLIERQIAAGIHGLVLAGSTGEGQTLRSEEFDELLKIASEYRDRIHLMASCGASSTWETAAKMNRARQAGMHSALVSSPPYNKPTGPGIVAHFKELARLQPKFPIMVYNIPGRTAVALSLETLQELWTIPELVALKESSGQWSFFLDAMRVLPQGKKIFCGDDPFSLAFWTHGAEGTVSVISNAAPQQTLQLWSHFKSLKFDLALAQFRELEELTRLSFTESNPIPIKWAVSQIVKTDLTPRLPLLVYSEKHRSGFLSELKRLKLV